MKINIVRPSGEHSGIFAEWAEVMYFSLLDLGHEVNISLSQSIPDSLNIVIGIFYPNHFLDSLKDDTIIINTEPLFGRPNNLEWTHKVIHYAKRYQIWDYDLRNIQIFEGLGVHGVQLFRFGYQKQLERIESRPDTQRPMDVLFYGSTNLRRKIVLDQIQFKKLLLGTLFNSYGIERDEQIAKSKLVINMHHEDVGSFEIVRIHYLLNNGVAVLSEVSATTSIEARFFPCIATSTYSDFADNCLALIDDPDSLNSLREKALIEYRKFPQAEFMEKLIQNSQ